MVKRSAWIFMLLLITAACLDEPDCFNLNNYVVGIGFKKLSDSSADTVLFAQVRVEEPALLILSDTAIFRMNGFLNYFKEETTLIFEREEQVDMLRLGYVSQAQFVSEDCGEKFVLTELQVLETSFDSVRLIQNIPTSQGGTIHIEIFQ